MLAVGWRASALRGEEAGRLRVACPSLLRAVHVRGRHLNSRQPSGFINKLLISIFRLWDESSSGDDMTGDGEVGLSLYTMAA